MSQTTVASASIDAGVDRQTLTILYVARGAPYPPRSGAPLRMWQNINALATRGRVHVMSFGDREPDADAMPVVHDWTHIDASSVPKRYWSGIKRLKKLLRPRQFPFENDYVTSELNRKLRDLVNRLEPDVVVLSHWDDAFPDALKGISSTLIVDAHNIESSLAQDLDRVQGRSSLDQRLRQLRHLRREQRMFRRADRVWVVSEDDARAVSALSGSPSRPVVWPNTIDVVQYAAVREKTIALPDGLTPNGHTILFVGFYGYPPNKRAAKALINEIFPKVRERFPQARLLLVGKQPSPEMLEAAARDTHIVVTGIVDDVRPYLALGDVCAVPLSEGGGSRLKILEAFASMVPVVSTAKGAEGIKVQHREHLVFAEDNDSMASAICELFEDSELRHAMTENALRLVREAYSWESLLPLLDEALPLPNR